MKISLRFIPVILFFVFYGLIQISFTQLRKMEENEDKQETNAILEIVTDRFKRYLELPYMMGVLGQQFLSPDIRKINYEQYAELVKYSNHEFLGFNILDDKGLIIRTFPDGTNAQAMGRRSQMLGPLLESYEKGDPFYLSPPFRLFQGQQGFVFYFPVKKNDKLQGWYAIVISAQAFLEKFSLHDFLEVYDLNIIDEETKLDYFATSLEPKSKEARLFSKSLVYFGRKMQFTTWRKEETPLHTFPWYFSVIFSLVLSAASWFMISLYEQRRRARGQLENISVLLRVTSKEALGNLIDIHSEFNQLNIPEDERFERLSRDITYLTNLIEQIDLLQTMAHTREGFAEGEQNFTELFRQQLDNFSEVLRRKHVKVEMSDKEFTDFKLKVNELLFGNSVLSNILSHLLIYIEPNSTLKVTALPKSSRPGVAFQIRTIPTASHSPKLVTRRLEVARKVLQLQMGDLREFHKEEELTITIYLPA